METLEQKIREIQELMIAYATNGRTDQQPREYQELYIDLALDLERSGFSNPNPHKTIESFWSECGGTWAERRRLVGELYADVLFEMGMRKRRTVPPRNWQAANERLTNNLDPVRRQWLKAKNLLQAVPPDFENSIKESIGAVESCLKILFDEPNKTLGQMAKDSRLDRDIRRIISTAYGAASDRDFVRHGGIQDSQLTLAEARFFIEFCATAIIYCVTKLPAPKSNI